MQDEGGSPCGETQPGIIKERETGNRRLLEQNQRKKEAEPEREEKRDQWKLKDEIRHEAELVPADTSGLNSHITEWEAWMSNVHLLNHVETNITYGSVFQ